MISYSGIGLELPWVILNYDFDALKKTFWKKSKWVVFSFVYFTLDTVYNILGSFKPNPKQDNKILELVL